MGTIDIVYGYIQAPLEAGGAVRNREAIAALPPDDAWPPLAQPLFSFAPEVLHLGGYRTQVIHFGGAFKEIWRDWDVWLSKFERLLGECDWTRAVVHLESELLGNFTYAWDATPDATDRTTREWRFEGGPRSFRD